MCIISADCLVEGDSIQKAGQKTQGLIAYCGLWRDQAEEDIYLTARRKRDGTDEKIKSEACRQGVMIVFGSLL
jgi:hypothetical protein